MSIYISYDIRGIQQSIFAVPRLKYIVGASAMIAQLDRETSPAIARELGGNAIFCGGGRGLFSIEEPKADELKSRLIRAVNGRGLDVRIGQSRDLLQAVKGADDLFTAIPDGDLEGEPCAASGLFPVPQSDQPRDFGHGAVHRIIQERVVAADKDFLGNALLKKVLACQELSQIASADRVEFMRNVNPEDDGDRSANLGKKAIGSNQWAVLVFDGNDIGKQHEKARQKFRNNPEAHSEWLKQMSRAIDECTVGALAEALKEGIIAWWAKHREEWVDAKHVVLPFRPLIAGGDDILLLAHPQAARKVASSISRKFSELADEANRKAGGELWLGTGGKLTLSCGVVYAPLSFPLATIITYAETLMAGAKAAGRANKKGANTAGDAPSPAMIDWEVITEGAVENPAARRRRELIFEDKDDADAGGPRTVYLTRRPWAISEIDKRLEQSRPILAKLPRSLRHDLMTGLRQAAWARMRMLIRMKKNWPEIFEHLKLIPRSEHGDWWTTFEDGKKITTDVIDLLLLLEFEDKHDEAGHQVRAVGTERELKQ